MKFDNYGNPIFTEQDLLDEYMSNPDLSLKKCFTDQKIIIDPIIDLNSKIELIEYIDPKIKKEEFDSICQNIWLMPEEYKNLDIANFVLEQCQGEEELQRAGKELIMFQERDLFPLLQYLKYLVDTMRTNSIVWGVGRGSSVASFVLFLIGIHRVNSLFYGLEIEEFLK
jgi:DNA polymerase III alpha subunit